MQGAVLRLQIWKTHFRLSGLSHLAPEQDLQQLQENTHLQNYISHLQPLRICTPRKNQRWLTELKTHPPNSGAHWPPRSPTAEGGRARDLFNSLCDRSLPSGVICSRSLHSRPCTDETQTDAPVSLKCTNDQVCSAEQQDEKDYELCSCCNCHPMISTCTKDSTDLCDTTDNFFFLKQIGEREPISKHPFYYFQ